MKSINRKLIPAIAVALAVAFMINNYTFANILKEEVLNQWKTEDIKLVKAYAQIMEARGCSTTEEYQTFIDDISSQDTFNYVLYMEDVDGAVTSIAHSNHERIGIVLEDAGSLAATREGQEYAGYFVDEVTGGMTLDVLTPIYDETGTLKGALNIGIPIDDKTMSGIIQGAVQQSTIICVILAIVLILILSLSVYLLLLKPLNLLGRRIEKLSQYDLREEDGDVLKHYGKRSDEIGMISSGFLIMQESLSGIITNIRKVADNLTSHSEELSNICTKVNDSGVQLSKTVEDVAKGASTQAEQTTSGNEQIGKLSDMIEVVENNMNSLRAATDSVDKLEKQGVDTLETLVKNTEKNYENSRHVHDAIDKTSLSTEKIKNASDQIHGIAQQTNLLALNASIEAARAGEAGKGFAVVATEIGELSHETNALTTQIEGIISELIEKMQEAVKTVAGMEQLSEEQNQSVEETREKFEEITKTIQIMEEECSKLSDSTVTMKENRSTIVDVFNDLSALSEENAACMEEASASVATQSDSIEKVSISSQKVAGLAEKLNEQIAKFIV